MNPVSLVLRGLSLFNTQPMSQVPLQPGVISNNGTSFLDHVTPISGFFGQTFLEDNIPFIDIPDSNIQDVYYYRWSSLQRHLRYTVAGTGYIITEFVQPVGYAQALNTIDAAAGHQIDEARWLRSQFYDDDYILAYTRGPGNTTQYTHWILDAMFRRSQVNGDTQYTTEQLSDMAKLWGYWDSVYDTGAGLYYFTPNWDAQEYSLPGYIVAPDGGQLQLDGPNTYRPDHNAYMVANARAIAQVATQAGDSATASDFSNIADQLERNMYTKLWDPAQNFFVDVIRPNNPNLTKVNGREEVGLFPFRFGIGLDVRYANVSAQQLFDPQGFLATYGPTTLEIRNQYYYATKPSGYCCFWNGQSWPFSTSHVLKSLAAIYRSGNSSITAEQFIQYMSIYATTQHKNGVPYVSESHYPSMDAWSADGSNHSEHYQREYPL
jgi:Trehalase